MKKTITLYIQPGAKKTEVSGQHNGYVKIRLKAPPVDGKANQALIDFLSDALKLKKHAIKIIRGEKSRLKTVEIQNGLSLSSTLETLLLDRNTDSDNHQH